MNMTTDLLPSMNFPYVIVYIPLATTMRTLHIPFGIPSLILIFVSGNISFTTFLYTNFIRSLPRELEEAAEIDGCSGPQVFFKIVLPLSKAMLGVILLYYAVGRWNNYTSSLYYQPTAPELHSLQMVIKKMVLQMQSASDVDSEMAEYYANLFNQIKYSVIVITSLPLLVLYPFLQKYFEKGVMIGSVKG